ncbi:hypothetical protein [Falsibacillus pallidus]|uniref:hypothetical protein n=1 Tax=Falsibacillus pallidus TaxID=493781 RepID=UPI003D995A31
MKKKLFAIVAASLLVFGAGYSLSISTKQAAELPPMLAKELPPMLAKELPPML